MRRSEGMSAADRKLLFWIGLAFVVFAVVIARLMTGTWFGILLGVGYLLLWLSPIAPGLAHMIDNDREDAIGSIIKERDEEISRLRGELSAAVAKKDAASAGT